jgi:hypothetical protein
MKMKKMMMKEDENEEEDNIYQSTQCVAAAVAGVDAADVDDDCE